MWICHKLRHADYLLDKVCGPPVSGVVFRYGVLGVVVVVVGSVLSIRFAV